MRTVRNRSYTYAYSVCDPIVFTSICSKVVAEKGYLLVPLVLLAAPGPRAPLERPEIYNPHVDLRELLKLNVFTNSINFNCFCLFCATELYHVHNKVIWHTRQTRIHPISKILSFSLL